MMLTFRTHVSLRAKCRTLAPQIRGWLFASVSLAAAGLGGTVLPAADLYWSGTGTWDTTTQNWGTTSGGPYNDAVWSSATPDAATFQGTAGTVTVDAGGITADRLSFTADGYAVTGGTITLGGGQQISVAPSVSATIDSAWAGTGSTTGISGGGTLTVGSSMSLGTLAADTTLIVNGGTMTAALRNSASVPAPIAGRLQINAGARFIDAAAFHVFGAPVPTTHPGIWINGGELASSGGVGHSYYVPSGTSAASPGMTMTGGVWSGADIRFNGISNGQPTAYIKTLASSSTATISAVRRSFGGGVQVYDIADGAAAVDVEVSGATGGVLVSGTTSLVKTGAGTMEFSVNQSFTGGLTVSQGTVWGRTSGAFGSGTITINNADTGASDTAVVISAPSSVITVANQIVVSANGSGTATIGGQSVSGTSANTYSGAITLNRDVLLQSGNSADGRTTFTGKITGSGGVTVTVGRVTYQGAGAQTNDYAGATTINSGAILQVGSEQVIPNASPMEVNGTFRFASGGTSKETVGRLSGSGTVTTHPTVSGTYTLETNQGTDSTFSGVINNGVGTLGLTKSGAGGLTLTGANTYTGATTVSGGTLLVNGSIAASSLTTVQTGAMLGGTGSVGATLVESGAFHSPGTSPGIQTVTSGLQYDAGSTLIWELFANATATRGTDYDGVDLTGGTLAIASGAILALDFGTTGEGSVVDWDDAFWGSDQSWTIIDVSGTGSWNGDLFDTLSVGADTLGRSLASVRPDASFSVADVGGDLMLEYVAVPEPAALPLAGLAAAAALGLARRRLSPKVS